MNRFQVLNTLGTTVQSLVTLGEQMPRICAPLVYDITVIRPVCSHNEVSRPLANLVLEYKNVILWLML
jgi:hypothetical protein